MGSKMEKGGAPASRKIQPASLMDWKRERRVMKHWSGNKPWKVSQDSGRGNQISEGHQNPWSGRFSIGGKKPLE